MNQAHIRAPEFNEKYYICRGSEGFYSNFNLIAKYNKPVSKALLSNGLRNFIIHNTWLAHTFVKTDDPNSKQIRYTNWERRFVDRINFDDAVTYVPINEFDESVIEYMNNVTISNYSSEKPLWHIVVFETIAGVQYIGIAYDHSSYDGMCGLEFHKDLIKELDKAEEEFIEFIFDYERDYEYLPSKITTPVETLTDLFIPSIWNVVNFYLQKYVSIVPKVLQYLKSLFTTNNPFKANLGVNPIFKWKPIKKDLRSKYRYFHYSPAEVSKLLAFTRDNGITLTPYFDIIATKCLQDTIFKYIDSKTQFSTTSSIAVNGRRYYSEDIKNFKYGTMVCGDIITLPPIGTDLLKYMKYLYKSMMDHIVTKQSFKLIGLYKYMDIFKYFNNRIGNKDGKVSVGISNLGRVISPEGCSFQIEDVYFGSNTALTYHFIINMVTTTNGLNVVLSYAAEYDEIYHDEKKAIDIFADKFYNTILDYAN
ncbi:alcohol acetyltransferase [Scheffersomyces amazonensis]|uniref:alcohol acetyltransferase n=1 Tax=Scheffersomyces amazonensis TaxID=1078765 RepID=UPI00315C7CEB